MKILLIALILMIPLASASMLPNETLDAYHQRMAAEMRPQNYTCGNGICEGLEANSCPQDCKLSNATTTTTIAAPSTGSSQLDYLLIGTMALAVFIAYNFMKLRTKLKR
ncbi:MAG: hypothetical protein V1836_00645 [Candidatus Aenigmatarchaeota archaeon]